MSEWLYKLFLYSEYIYLKFFWKLGSDFLLANIKNRYFDISKHQSFNFIFNIINRYFDFKYLYLALSLCF